MHNNKNKKTIDPTSAIYTIILEYCKTMSKDKVDSAEITPKILSKGFTSDQLKICINTYSDAGIWQWSSGSIRWLTK